MYMKIGGSDETRPAGFIAYNGLRGDYFFGKMLTNTHYMAIEVHAKLKSPNTCIIFWHEVQFFLVQQRNKVFPPMVNLPPICIQKLNFSFNVSGKATRRWHCSKWLALVAFQRMQNALTDDHYCYLTWDMEGLV
ncbi:hypothetical protein FCM35_KLT13499 [Carex littledalei]|uniref:Uncharacterized protein n=1 Tax=Carex littledalei TaxID=544730 RepID=A0A833QMQ7_9POAL|nr:hypothetical protein FCM35_KLT13499 [Carex littledalei]